MLVCQYSSPGPEGLSSLPQSASGDLASTIALEEKRRALRTRACPTPQGGPRQPPQPARPPDHELYTCYFPHGGASIFTFEINGGQDEAWAFIDHLKIFSLLANVDDVKAS